DVPEVRDVFRDRVDDRLREVLASFGPRALPQRVRRVLDETGHDVFSRRRQGGVQGGRHAHVDERAVGEVAVLRVVIRLLDVVDGRSDRDGALELRPVPREGGEAGGLLQGEVRLAGRPFDLEAFDAANEVRRKIGSFQELQEGPLRIRYGRDHL